MHSAKLHTFFNRYSVLLMCFDRCFSIDVFSSVFFHRCFSIDVFSSIFFHRCVFVDALFLYIDFMSGEAKFTAIHVALRHLTSQMIYHPGASPNEQWMHCWFNVMTHKPWITAVFVTVCCFISMVSNTRAAISSVDEATKPTHAL